jgi:putative hemolysin
VKRCLAVLLLVAPCVFAMAASTAPALAAPTWSAFQLPAAQETTRFYGMSCPTASFCVAAGNEDVEGTRLGAVAVSANPTGGPEAWSFANVDSVAEFRGVSCPSPTLCVAVDYAGNVATSIDPGGGPSSWTVTPLAPGQRLFGVSCSPSLCVVVGMNGTIATSTNPTGGSGAWSVSSLAEPEALHGVSCVSTQLCVAVALGGNIYSSTEPLAGAASWRVATRPDGLSSLNGVACPSLGLCVSGTSENLLISTEPTGPASSWDTGVPATGFQTTAVSCGSPTACVAVDNDGTAISSTDPTGGAAAWTVTKVIPGTTNGLFAISCQSPTFCAAAGSWGWIMTSTEPFAPDSASKTVPQRRLRPTTVRIDHHPRFLIRITRPRAHVAFRFHAQTEARAYRCRIDQHALELCHSPRRYRLGIGRHVFKVRAIGPTGLIGPAAIFHFRVTHR